MTKRKKLWIAFGIVLVTGWYVLSLISVNDLGLTGFDLRNGGNPDVDELRQNSKAAADAYLARRDSVFKTICDGGYTLSVSYDLTPRLRSLGYQSSFYYTSWNIYLPYSLKSSTGEMHVVLVQTSDGIPVHKHDPAKFHVIRAAVLAPDGSVREWIE